MFSSKDCQKAKSVSQRFCNAVEILATHEGDVGERVAFAFTYELEPLACRNNSDIPSSLVERFNLLVSNIRAEKSPVSTSTSEGKKYAQEILSLYYEVKNIALEKG